MSVIPFLDKGLYSYINIAVLYMHIFIQVFISPYPSSISSAFLFLPPHSYMLLPPV